MGMLDLCFSPGVEGNEQRPVGWTDEGGHGWDRLTFGKG